MVRPIPKVPVLLVSMATAGTPANSLPDGCPAKASEMTNPSVFGSQLPLTKSLPPPATTFDGSNVSVPACAQAGCEGKSAVAPVKNNTNANTHRCIVRLPYRSDG